MPDDVTAPPTDLAKLLESLGIDPTGLTTVPGAAPAQPQSLGEALIGSAMAVSGRRGATGQDFIGVLPPWAQDLSPQILGHPDFDPYLGVVSQQGDERVFMGDKLVVDRDAPTPGVSTKSNELNVERTGVNPNPLGGPEKVEQDKTLTATQVLNLPYTWSEEKITETMKRMRESGLKVTTFEEMGQVWQQLVQRASLTYSLSEGKNKVTPWDVLDLYKSEAKAAGGYVNYENGVTTRVAKSVSNITEGEAWATMQQTVAQMLGRDPSDQEVRNFAYKMNQLAAQNPSISKTVTRYKAGQESTSSTTTEAGFGAADMAEAAYDKAQNDPEYAEYQSATTYFNAALSALGAIGQT
jgi:hypothetical protein